MMQHDVVDLRGCQCNMSYITTSSGGISESGSSAEPLHIDSAAVAHSRSSSTTCSTRSSTQ
eukprot:2679936-Pyramimonas_sp.AAC.1